MSIANLNIGEKVTNDGATSAGKVTSSEFNELVDRVQNLIDNVNSSSPDAIKSDGDFELTEDNYTVPSTATRVYVGTAIEPSSSLSVTIPEGVELAFGRNGKLGANVKLSLNNTRVIASYSQQIFTPGMTISGPFNVPYIPVEWWGAKGDGVTDDSSAINNAIIYAGRSTVLMAAERYYVASTVRVVETESDKSYYDASSDQNYMSDGMYGQNILVRGSIWGGSGVSPVLYIDESCLTLHIDGAVVCHKDAERAVWANTERNSDVYINRIGHGRDYTMGATSATDASNNGFGTGVGFYHFCGNASRVKVNTIYGFKYGYKASTEDVTAYYTSWMCNTIELGNIVCTYPIYVHLVPNGTNSSRNQSFFNSNTITLQASTVGWRQKVQAAISADDYDTAIVTMIDETGWASSKVSDCVVDLQAMDCACYKVCHIQRTSGLEFKIRGAYNDVMGLNGIAGDSMRACCKNTTPYSDSRKILEFVNCSDTQFICNGTPTVPETMLIQGCTNFYTNMMQNYHNVNAYFMLQNNYFWYSGKFESSARLDDLGADTSKNGYSSNSQALFIDADCLDKWSVTTIDDESDATADGLYLLKYGSSKAYTLLDVKSSTKYWIGYVIPKNLKGDDGSLTNYPIVECAGEIVLSDCYPNRIYKADSAITTLSVDVIYYSDGTNGTDFSAHGNIADEYVFDFIAGASCSVSLPEAVVWAATPSFSEGKRYIISIVDNLGLCAEYTI